MHHYAQLYELCLYSTSNSGLLQNFPFTTRRDFRTEFGKLFRTQYMRWLNFYYRRLTTHAASQVRILRSSLILCIIVANTHLIFFNRHYFESGCCSGSSRIHFICRIRIHRIRPRFWINLNLNE